MLTTIRLAVTGMHCASCGLLVDETLEDLDGVVSASTDRRAGRTVVEVDTFRCSPAQLVDAIVGIGYAATTLD